MSTLFNLPVSHKEKEISHHPWENIMKYMYISKIKCAHNSIHNPHYPRKDEKTVRKDRIRFTVIGNRVTKEFIHCVNLTNGIYKYRSKYYDAPLIRGVTGVEWPLVWNDLKNRYGGLAYCLRSQVAILYNDQFFGGYEELKEFVESKYIYHFCLDYQKESVGQFVKFVKSSGRPCAYLHISINEEYIGTLIFMLFADIVPYTSDNFLRLCNQKKGGYGGTPVHRIVKDGWIQCGGFGLKSIDMDCENFIIPPDRRGLIGMANDGRHNDCSTQFFVLLQPAPWMSHKYVIFGQLIDGESVLQKIENIPTFYESPQSQIIINQAGILNLDCQDITINPSAKKYIQSHIEDLVTIGELFTEILMENVYLEIEFRRIQRLEQQCEDEGLGEDGRQDIRETKRFMRRKEEIQKQIERNSQVGSRRPSTAVSRMSKDDNNDFDVESYDYEPEEFSYQHATTGVASPVIKPEQPFYLPLTDVPYPGEVDSTYDLKKFLRGDYCHETDLDENAPKNAIPLENKMSYISEIFSYLEPQAEEESEKESVDLDSDEEREIKRYLKKNVDRVSFAGGIVRNIARGVGVVNILDNFRKSELITDEELRRFRLASMDMRARESKKVSISAPGDKGVHTKIKRRQTGFVRPEDIEKIRVIPKPSEDLVGDDDNKDAENPGISRKVRIAPTVDSASHSAHAALRRPTGFVRASDAAPAAGSDVERASVLVRLYDDVKHEGDAVPTLKDYRPASESHNKNTLLTFSPVNNLKEDLKGRLRPSLAADESYDQILNLQHGKRAARKISPDYVKAIDQIEQNNEISLRSVEYAKTRPSMSVSEYQMKNQKSAESRSNMNMIKSSNTAGPSQFLVSGVRLPGDSPTLLSDISLNI